MTRIDFNAVFESTKNLQPISKGKDKTCYRVGNYAVIVEEGVHQDFCLDSFRRTQKITNEFYKIGIKTPQVLYVGQNGPSAFMIQEFVTGRPLYFVDIEDYCSFYRKAIPIDDIQKHKITNEFFKDTQKAFEIIAKAPQEHYDTLLSSLIKMQKLGYQVDSSPSNFRYSKDKGFVFLDIPTEKAFINSEIKTMNKMVDIVLVCLAHKEMQTTNNFKLAKEIFSKCMNSAQKLEYKTKSATVWDLQPSYLKGVINVLEEYDKYSENNKNKGLLNT